MTFLTGGHLNLIALFDVELLYWNSELNLDDGENLEEKSLINWSADKRQNWVKS